MSLQFRSKLATQTSKETENEAESVEIDLEGEVAGGLEDCPAIDSDDPAVGSAPPTATHSRPSLSPDVMPLLPVRSKRSAARAQADEDKLLATLVERGRQSMELQHKLINLIKPANEREAYGDLAKYVMVGLHPTLWRLFQAEQSALLARYLDLDDRARGTQDPDLTLELTKHLVDPDSDAPRNEQSHNHHGGHGEHLAELVIAVPGGILVLGVNEPRGERGFIDCAISAFELCYVSALCYEPELCLMLTVRFVSCV